MAQRVRRPHRGQSPSSVTQLPILTALHARYPTLFGLIIHHSFKKVNTFLWNSPNIADTWTDTFILCLFKATMSTGGGSCKSFC